MKYLTNETVMLRTAWKRAFAQPEGLTIRFKTEAGAHRARMQLYNAVALQKKGKDLEDVQLTQAAEAIEIVWVAKGPDEWIIRMQHKDKNDMMLGLADALGAGREAFVDQGMVESAERMLKELGKLAKASEPEPPPEPEGELAHKDNPFYGKREE